MLSRGAPCCCVYLLYLQPAVWQSIRQRLVPGGRVMCNLGHPPGMAGANPAHMGRTIAALDAMAEAFEGEHTTAEQRCEI